MVIGRQINFEEYMTINVLICDDSMMARKQVARSLPDDWDIQITHATNGFECIEAIKAGNGDILLLDLNMPEMDGYQVLQTILSEDLPSLVIVISGDIQPVAHKRVMKLGALSFIEKPVSKSKLTQVLLSYGVITQSDFTAVVTKNINTDINSKVNKIILPTSVKTAEEEPLELTPALQDCYQEVANVAMGRAGELLAKLLNTFVLLPIPKVDFIEVSELNMALKAIDESDTTSGVCQGFISAGISGEALLVLNDSSFKDITALMNYPLDDEEGIEHNEMSDELEYLMDLANILIGACLKGLAEQLDISFSQGHLTVLGQHRDISDLIAQCQSKWQKTLSIELSYVIEGYDIKCDLLLLFTANSIKTLNNKLIYLIE